MNFMKSLTGIRSPKTLKNKGFMHTRTCPVCKVPLREITVKGRIHLDMCLTCRGLWFDRNELSQVQTAGRLPDTLLTTPARPRDQIICEQCGAPNDRAQNTCTACGAALRLLCPVCRVQMEEVQVGNVFIDRCQRCQGVWLDGGELRQLFEEFKRKKQQEAARGRQQGGTVADDLLTWMMLDNALDVLIWRPDVLQDAGGAVADAVTGLPEAVAGGVGAAIDGVGELPDLAGDVAGGTVEFAGQAAGMAGDMVEGAMDLASDLPEMAGAVAEAGASFIEVLFEILGSLFDN